MAYNDSVFTLLFLFIILAFLIVIVSIPYYKNKVIVPSLVDANYGISSTSAGSGPINATFQDLYINDGEGGNSPESTASYTGEAIDFGGSGPDTVPLRFSPDYLDSQKSLKGYFKLYLTSHLTNPVYLLFRTYDKAKYPNGIISTEPDGSGSLGWASVIINPENYINPPLYPVNVPFDADSTSDSSRHLITVQIASGPSITGGTISSHSSNEIELNSAEVFYF